MNFVTSLTISFTLLYYCKLIRWLELAYLHILLRKVPTLNKIIIIIIICFCREQYKLCHLASMVIVWSGLHVRLYEDAANRPLFPQSIPVFFYAGALLLQLISLVEYLILQSIIFQ